MSYEELVLDYIESKRDEIIAFMQTLLKTESVTGSEAKIGALMAEECKKDGLDVELVNPVEGRTSVIARYKGTIGKPKVMMYSHYDTVPPGDLNTWTYPPFSGKIVKGEIWGRGAQDNKIATCGLTMAFRALNKLGIKLKGDIIFTHVADEEKGGHKGFRVLIERGYGKGVDYLFYGHGGEKESIGIAANGCRQYHIIIKGKAVHTSRVEQGVNAVIKAAKLINHLEKLADIVNARRHHLPRTDTIMKSRFSINKCVGYIANNSIPDSCEILIDRRFTPAETADQTEKEIQEVIDRLKNEDPNFDADIYTDTENMAMLSVSPPDSILVQSMQKAAEKVAGIKPNPIGGSHSSDHGWFVSKHHRPVASYGIGGVGAHSANERIKVEDVILTTKVYALIILDLLGVE